MAQEQPADGNTPIPTTESDVPMPPAGEQSQPSDSNVSSEQWQAMQSLLNTVYAHRMEDDHDPSKVFHRKVNKRALPTYYDVIKEPIALSTIKAKINLKEYKEFAECVRDFALISHNAQVYNRPDAGAYQDALEIKSVVERELKKLVDEKVITKEIAKSPELGEIPPPDEFPVEEAEEEEEEEDDEEEDDEAEESDDSRGKKRGRGRPRGSTNAARAAKAANQDEVSRLADIEAKKKRGRPPKVDTPMEARIKNVLKGMRRFKNQAGQLQVSHFDRLPDKALMPEYFNEIKAPMAIDVIKKKFKRKKYQSVEQFMKDVELMFENAKIYNQDESEIYKDAVDLQEETRALALQETQKPDSDFVMEDGRLPMPNGILHNGELYKVGDWVHIQNPNDLTKPIPTQIYRTWQDSDGQKWINACWYYRPEQTVHRFDRHFLENEVVKTGQYRDHQIDEIVDRCFIMFITRYNKGRPRGFPPDKEVYVCEARYNEEKHKLNKIKTWASCLPDEVRDKDYEMDLFDAPKKMKKLPSPIAYLLKDDAEETDDLPKPEWGADNAPPKIGAVHKRPRDPKDSPPPEPTPTPPPEPPPPAPRQQPPPVKLPRPSENYVKDQPTSQSPNVPIHPAQTPSQIATQQAIANLMAQQAAQRNQYQTSISPAPVPRHAAETRSSGFSAHTPQTYTPRETHHQATHNASSQSTSRYQPQIISVKHPVNYKAPPPTEVWHLGDGANAQIPSEIREQFQCDERGHVLFFTSPPLEIKQNKTDNENLGHSARYLAAKGKRDVLVAAKRKVKESEQAQELEQKIKRRKQEDDRVQERAEELFIRAMDFLDKDLVESTRVDYQSLYGRKWKESMSKDLSRLHIPEHIAHPGE